MDKKSIEKQARDLQIEIWKARDSLWPNNCAPPLTRMFSAPIAAEVLGIRYECVPELGRFGNGRDRYEVAGSIDRRGLRISVSERFSPSVQAFTGAHEVAHWVLHPDHLVLHRDRPISGLCNSFANRPREEAEADYFAACFMVPAKLLIQLFKERFDDIERFRLNDNTAFMLCPHDPGQLMSSEESSLEYEAAIASAQSFGGKHFDSLASIFGVSISTMSIRLREVGLRR